MTSTRARRIVAPLLALALAFAALLLTPAPASAAQITVTSAADSGTGTLREAIADSGPGDEIVFDATISSVTLTAPIFVQHGLTITGPGAGALMISTSDAAALFFAPTDPDQDLTITGMTFDGADVGESAILVVTGPSSARDVTFRDVALQRFTLGPVMVASVLGDIEVTDSVFTSNTGVGGFAGGLTVANSDGDVTIRDTVFTGNMSEDAGGGLVLVNVAGATTLERATFEGNTAVDGGGAVLLGDVGTVSVIDSVFEGNEVTDGNGGAIRAEEIDAALVVTGSTFLGNSAEAVDWHEAFGGAISIDEISAPLVLSTTSVLGNSVMAGDGYGTTGAVAIGSVLAAGALLVDSSTFADNPNTDPDSDFDGAVGLGVGWIEDGATFDILNSTFRESTDLADETSGYAVWVWDVEGEVTIAHSTLEATLSVLTFFTSTPVRIENSILTRAVVLPENDDIPNLMVGTFALSHNVLTGYDEPAFYDDLGGNQFRVDPLLGPLQDNGGPTFTMMPADGSPAIDMGTLGSVVPAFDQRGDGFPRVVAGRVDVGAVETAVVVPTPTPTPTPTSTSTPVPASVTAMPPTGQTIPPWIPIAGGVLLLGGIFAVVIPALLKRHRGSGPGSE